jgi:hypothetical protein
LSKESSICKRKPDGNCPQSCGKEALEAIARIDQSKTKVLGRDLSARWVQQTLPSPMTIGLAISAAIWCFARSSPPFFYFGLYLVWYSSGLKLVTLRAF